MANLTELIARVAADLRDVSHETWSSDELTDHVRRAVRGVTRARPRRLETLVPTTSGATVYSLDALDDLLAVLDVIYPHDPAGGRYPAQRPAYRLLADGYLELLVDDPPTGDGSDDILVIYAAEHTLEGLDGATASTLWPQAEEAVVLGAAGYAVEQLALSLVGTVTIDDAPARYGAWAAQRLRQFYETLEELAAVGRHERDPRVTWEGEV